MFNRLKEVLLWLDKGWITEAQFDAWVEWRVFHTFSMRVKDINPR